MNEHLEVLAACERELISDPDNRETLFNAGLAAYLLGQPNRSVIHWTKLKLLTPEDWRVRSKLIQAYQALGRGPERDAERAEMFQLRNGTEDAELRQAKNYCRDQFTAGNSRVLVFEFFELEGDAPIRYCFDLLDGSGQSVVARYTLGSNEATNELARETGQIQQGQRMFHLDGYKPGGAHETYGFIVGEPNYDQVRSAVLEILQGTRPLISQTKPTPTES